MLPRTDPLQNRVGHDVNVLCKCNELMCDYNLYFHIPYEAYFHQY